MRPMAWVLLASTAVTLVASCAIRPTRAVPANSAAAFAALCMELKNEPGFDFQRIIYVLPMTRPIYDISALRQLKTDMEVTFENVSSDRSLETQLTQTFRPRHVRIVSRAGDCTFRMSSQDSSKGLLLLELSNPVTNPFRQQARSTGIFARLSLDGAQGASWYWIELAGRNAAMAFPLNVSDG